MVSRYRNELISAKTGVYEQIGRYSDPFGSCTVDPGASTTRSYTFDHSGVFQSEYEYREMNDVVTPSFHAKRARGEIINSPMTSMHVKQSIPKMSTHFSSMACKWGCTPGRWYPFIEHEVQGDRSLDSIMLSDLWMPAPAIDTTTLKDQAISKAWSNIDVSELLAVASIKELDQTVVGLAYIFKKVYKILRSVMRADIRLHTGRGKPSKLMKEISPSELSEIYLNARYNLRPLMYDVSNMIKVINSPMTHRMRQTFRGNLVRTEKDSDVLAKYVVQHANFDLKATCYRSVQKEVTVRAGVLCDVEPLTLSDLLGGDELVGAAWDLLPFSFIIDWFCNAGDTIIAWSPNLRATTLASWVVTKTVTTQTSTLLGCTANAYDGGTYHWTNTTGYVDPGTATSVTTEVERIPEYSRPVIPSFRLNLDPLKILDLGLILFNLKGFKFSSSG